MNVVTEISVPVAISIVTALCAVAASWAVVKFQSVQHDRRLARLEAGLAAQGKELSDFKVEAVQRFVSDEMLAKVETRITDAINRMADRLDKVLDARTGGRGRAG
ncbi:hypothetical protein ACXIUS_01405 [Bosea thiooxidans]